MVSTKVIISKWLLVFVMFLHVGVCFSVEKLCATRCAYGRGGVLCHCSATHFAGKRSQTTSRLKHSPPNHVKPLFKDVENFVSKQQSLLSSIKSVMDDPEPDYNSLENAAKNLAKLLSSINMDNSDILFDENEFIQKYQPLASELQKRYDEPSTDKLKQLPILYLRKFYDDSVNYLNSDGYSEEKPFNENIYNSLHPEYSKGETIKPSDVLTNQNSGSMSREAILGGEKSEAVIQTIDGPKVTEVEDNYDSGNSPNLRLQLDKLKRALGNVFIKRSSVV